MKQVEKDAAKSFRKRGGGGSGSMQSATGPYSQVRKKMERIRDSGRSRFQFRSFGYASASRSHDGWMDDERGACRRIGSHRLEGSLLRRLPFKPSGSGYCGRAPRPWERLYLSPWPHPQRRIFSGGRYCCRQCLETVARHPQNNLAVRLLDHPVSCPLRSSFHEIAGLPVLALGDPLGGRGQRMGREFDAHCSKGP